MHRDDEIDKELRFHLEERAADLTRTGLSPEEARRQAQLEFGGVVQTKEATREGIAPWMASIASIGNRRLAPLIWRGNIKSIAFQ